MNRLFQGMKKTIFTWKKEKQAKNGVDKIVMKKFFKVFKKKFEKITSVKAKTKEIGEKEKEVATQTFQLAFKAWREITARKNRNKRILEIRNKQRNRAVTYTN